jgi:DNA gyrase subunit A
MGMELKEDDYIEHLFVASTHDYILFFTNVGKVYRLKVHELPLGSRQSKGRAIVNLLPFRQDETVRAVVQTRNFEEAKYLVFATKNGVVKKTRISEFDSSIRSGLKAINLHGSDELVKVIQTTGRNDIVMVSREGMTIRFAESGVRAMGRDTAGVHGMKLRSKDDAVIGCDVARRGAVMLFVSSSGHGKRTKLDLFKRQNRGGQGVRGMKITAARGGVVGAFCVNDTDEILVFSSAGNIIRMGAREISAQGRDATGVRVARLGAGESVVAVAPVLEADDGEDLSTV